MSTEVEIRPYRDEDNTGVLEVARALGVPSRIRIGVDRSPEYLAFSRAQSPDHQLLVAESQDGRIVAFADVCSMDFRVLEERMPVLYMSLAGVLPQWRNTGLGKGLAAAVDDVSRQMGAELWTGLVSKGNTAVLRAMGIPKTPHWYGVPWQISCLIPGHRYARSDTYSYGQATPDQIAAVVELVDDFYKRFDAAPARASRARLLTLPGLDEENVWVAHDRSGRIVASLALWDHQTIRRIRVLGYRWPDGWLRYLWNLPARVIGLPKLPPAGGAFKLLYAVYVSCRDGCGDALRGLLSTALSDNSHREHTFVIFALPKDDPLSSVVRGLWGLSYENVPVMVDRTRNHERLLKDERLRNVYFEYALS